MAIIVPELDEVRTFLREMPEEMLICFKELERCTLKD